MYVQLSVHRNKEVDPDRPLWLDEKHIPRLQTVSCYENSTESLTQFSADYGRNFSLSQVKLNSK